LDIGTPRASAASFIQSGEIHQVEVLHVGARTQMLHEAPEGRSLELGSGVVVKRHEDILSRSH
jgi:hypothetical protein